MRAEIITVGSELVFGRTIDTHSAYLSRECFQLGIEVFYHTSVGDNRERLYQSIALARSRSDLVFLCGGLGPTMDDLTKETLADFLEIELVQDGDTLQRLNKIFAHRTFIPSNNLKQTYVFPTGTVFINDYGTAPGLAVIQDGVIYVLLPGPPSELIPMFRMSVKGFLEQIFNEGAIRTHTLSFFGIGESDLEDRLQDIMVLKPDLRIATYAKEAELTLCITAKADDLDQINQQIQSTRSEILDRVGVYCFSEDEESLEEITISFLRKSAQSISVAESCSGGLLSYLLSTVPGSSRELKGGSVCYTNQIKNEVVGVPEIVLNMYGAVSSQTAEVLAERTRECFQTDFSLSITGIAGPAKVEEKPIGLVYIALAEKNQTTRTYQFQFSGSRKRIQLFAAKYALFILLQRIKKGE